MYERLYRSFELFQASLAVLRKDRMLLVFPLFSIVALALLALSFLLPLGGMRVLEAFGGHGRSPTAIQEACAFLFYLIQYFIIFFFNTALAGAVMKQLDGEMPTIADGLRIAASRLFPIIGYAFIAATVGMLLHALQERLGIVGRIVAGLLGVAWSLATYLVVPVLVASDVGPIQAIVESADLFKRTWGESVIGKGGLGLAFAAIYVVVILCGSMLMCLAGGTLHSRSFMVLVQLVLVGALLLIGLLYATLSGIYAVALYRHANGFHDNPEFDARWLDHAFQLPGS
ncbi:MAG TPA: DUF6159 family protein [Steroidobacteraceae bacterium]